MKMRTVVLVSLSILTVAGCSAPEADSSAAALGDLVAITDGSVRGIAASESEGIFSFKGIPYAKPPVADLRWQPPQSAEAWAGSPHRWC